MVRITSTLNFLLHPWLSSSPLTCATGCGLPFLPLIFLGTASG